MEDPRVTSRQTDLFDSIDYAETYDTEFKSAKGGLPLSLWETYSAFANTNGGTIILGVSEKAGDFAVEGLDNPQKLITDFWNLINNRGKINRNLLSNSDVQSHEIKNRQVIIIRVPRAGRTEKPIYVGQDPFSGTFRRDHTGDYKCREDEVRRMFADQSEISADNRIIDGFNLDDLHEESIKQFRNRMASAYPNHPWLNEDNIGLLTKLGGWRIDREQEKEGLSVAGLVMFGRDETIAEGVSGFHVDYKEWLSTDDKWSHRIASDGTWNGNLFNFYLQVFGRLSQGISTPFRVDKEGHRKAFSSVHEALQEALVNALIHADYSGQGGIVVNRFSDKFEFSNPGTLLISREQLIQGGISECRNKSLQKMFQLMGAGDKAGSGIDKIRRRWIEQHWQSPRLAENYRPDRVMLTLPMITTLPPAIIGRLHARFGDKFKNLTQEEVQTLVTAEVEGEISNQRLQETLTLHRVDITQMLRKLVERSFLQAEGTGRGTHYYPVNESSGSISSIGLDESSIGLGETSIGLGETSIGLGETSIGLDESSIGLESGSPSFGQFVEKVKTSRKTPKETVKKAILEVCSTEYRSLKEISTILERDAVWLRNGYINSMLRDGHLVLMYPDTPNHQNQKYKTVPKSGF